MKVRFNAPEDRPADVHEGIRVPYAPARRAFPRWRWYLVVLLVASPLLFFLARVAMNSVMARSPGVVAMERVAVNSPRPAVVESLHVLPGTFVEEGTPLLRLTDASLEILQAPLEAERQALTAGQGGRRRFDAAGRASLLPSLVAAASLTREAVAFEQKRLLVVEELFRKGAATRAELDEASGRVQRARADLIRAEGEIRSGQAAQEILVDPQVAVRLAQIEAELRSLEESRGPLEVKSPLAGQVLEVFVSPGEAVGQGAPLVRLADPERISLITFVAARDMRFVEADKEVQVRFPGNQMKRAFVAGRPSLAQSTPTALAGPLADTSPALRVRLVLDEPLPLAFRVDGLPLRVYWGSRWRWPAFFQRIGGGS